MSDLISRQAAIDALAKAMPPLTTPDGCGEFDHEIQIADEAFMDAMRIINDLPSVPLYGYKIEHLAYIAAVMEKEGVTAEYAVKTFDNISRAVKMTVDEIQEKIEKVLNE